MIVTHPDLTGYAPPAERWSAYDDDTYDGAPDAGPQIVGHGTTAEEAIADYWDQIGDGDPEVMKAWPQPCERCGQVWRRWGFMEWALHCDCLG